MMSTVNQFRFFTKAIKTCHEKNNPSLPYYFLPLYAHRSNGTKT